MDQQQPPFPLPALLAAPAAAHHCGVSERTWRSLDRQARIPAPRHIGRRRVWSREELEAWIRADMPAREGWETTRRNPGRPSRTENTG